MSTDSEQALVAIGPVVDDRCVDLDDLLHRQDGVLSRRQVLDAGLPDHHIRRLLRRREWARVHDGVYVDHTGPLSWSQRAWAAVLYAAPAALCQQSVLSDSGPVIHVAVARDRAMLVEPDGVRIHHLAHLDERTLWHVSPPRLRYEEAALDVASAAATEFEAIAILADACQSRHTTAARLQRTLQARRRIRHRHWLTAVQADISTGACSVLEHAYLRRVERAHGLPRAMRQQRAELSVGVCYRDTEYGRRLVVELDGRLFHDSAAARNRDFERDLAAAADGRLTVRLSYQQVLDRPCQTAVQVAKVMQQNGIAVHGRECGPRCAFGQHLDLVA